MRQYLLLGVLLALTLPLFGQSPQKFKFQAVARDISGQPYANVDLGVRISLVRDAVSGQIDYAERHVVTTSSLGVFDLEIGGGQTISGAFTDASWANHPYYLKIDIDPDGGANYVNLGTSQLLSVPYAIYAGEAGNAGDGDSTDELQTLIYDPDLQTLALTNGNVVNLAPSINTVQEICKVDQNPNLIPELETVNPDTQCVVARDTINHFTYEYVASLPVGTRWIQSPTFFRADTVTVCNDGSCDFTTLKDAFEYAAKFQVKKESAPCPSGDCTFNTVNLSNNRFFFIQVNRNSDGSITTLSDRIRIERGDWSYITLTSNSDTVYYSPTNTSAGLNIFMNFSNCVTPKIENLKIINIDQAQNREIAFNLYNARGIDWISLSTERFERHINSTLSEGFLIGMSFKEGYPANKLTYGAVFHQGDFEMLDSSTDGFKTAIQLKEGAKVTLERFTARNWTEYGVSSRGGFLTITEGDFRSDGATETPNDIVAGDWKDFDVPGIILMRNPVMGGANIPYNTPTQYGIIYKVGATGPFNTFAVNVGDAPRWDGEQFIPQPITDLSDGNKGDITVSNSGAIWDINTNTIGPSELQNTSVEAGVYKNADITVDAQGRLTSAANGEPDGHATIDSAPSGTPFNINLQDRFSGIYRLPMANAPNPLTLTVDHPQDGGVYTFHFLQVNNNQIVFPANFYYANETSIGTLTLTASDFLTCYYSGSNFYCK